MTDAETMTIMPGDKLDLPNEEAGRAAINRARVSLQESAEETGLSFHRDEVIESTKYGYRLNPSVLVVPLEDFLN